MSNTARDRRRAIAFVFTSLALLAFVFALLGGVNLARRDRPYFVAVPTSVSGLRAASTVEYKGVPVGVVRGISFQGGSVETVAVEIAINRGVPIKVDTRARLLPQGITGLSILELVGGTAASADLPENGYIPIEPSLMGELESSVHDVAAVARRLNAATATVASDAVAAVAELRAALVACRGAARTLEATMAAIGSEANLSGAAFRATSEDLRAILQEPAWRSLGGEVLATVEDIRRVVAKLETAAGDAERLAQENRGDVRALVENLRRASSDARTAARRVRESPASLLVEHPPLEKPIPDPLPPRGGR
jgi:phospholipid/cholesterol/gamma-HCH transport system substrate-binding protein